MLTHFKSLTSTLLCLLIVTVIFGQSKSSYTQYMLNNSILNPALIGIDNHMDVKISNRSQWVGIPGAPVTSYISIQTPLNTSVSITTPTSLPYDSYDTSRREYINMKDSIAGGHGLGLFVLNDRTGYLNRWTMSSSYAFHKPISSKAILSAGINAGVSSINLDKSKVDFAGTNPFDPAIGDASNELTKIRFELGAGLWLHTNKFFTGVSFLNIVAGKSVFTDSGTYGEYYTPNLFFTSGYKFNLTPDITAQPSVMLQYWKPKLTGINVSCKFQYQSLLWLGANYSISDLVGGYSAMAGINISNIAHISYAYEIANSSRLRGYTNNSHEILLGIMLNRKKPFDFSERY